MPLLTHSENCTERQTLIVLACVRIYHLWHSHHCHSSCSLPEREVRRSHARRPSVPRFYLFGVCVCGPILKNPVD